MDEREELAALRRLAELESKRRGVASSAPAIDPTEGMSTFQKYAAGMGKAGYDAARGLGQMIGAVSRKDIEDARKLDGPLMNTTAGQLGNITGNVAVLAPAALIPGAGTDRKSVV